MGDATLRPARVSRVDRGVCTVMTGTEEARVALERRLPVVVGDWVGLAGSDGGSEARIGAVLPRRAVFHRTAPTKGASPRAVAANIDTVFICDALDGQLGLRHLERFLALSWQSGATPVIVITKSDTVEPDRLSHALAAVGTVAHGVEVVVISALTGAGVQGLAPHLGAGRTVALLGLSGAGKSTLANLLAGARVLTTGEVRRDGSGRHTTTHRQLLVLPDGGLLIDTPGMRALSVLGAAAGVEQAFDDLEVLAGSCRYASCSHSGEPGCMIGQAVSEGRLAPGRLEAWRRLTAEQTPSAAGDARGAVAERKRRKAAKFAERRASKA